MNTFPRKQLRKYQDKITEIIKDKIEKIIYNDEEVKKDKNKLFPNKWKQELYNR